MVNSKQFYTKLTPQGLAKRKEDIHTASELSSLKNMLDKKDSLLDLGCGYGRFTIPLAKLGFRIEGVDITPILIEQAKKEAKKNNLYIKFKVGDMRSLPYQKEKFNTIICMWSVFMEITKKKDQLKALREMIRVLKPNGHTIIELPKPFKLGSVKQDKKMNDIIRIGKNSIIKGKLSGIEHMPSYRHNKETLTSLMKEEHIQNYQIYTKNFGGRERLFLEFWKK